MNVHKIEPAIVAAEEAGSPLAQGQTHEGPLGHLKMPFSGGRCRIKELNMQKMMVWVMGLWVSSVVSGCIVQAPEPVPSSTYNQPPPPRGYDQAPPPSYNQAPPPAYSQPADVDVYVNIEPPPPRPEPIPRVRRGWVWVAGYWAWRPAIQRYDWVPGHWERPRAGYRTYVPGHWERRPRGWVYIPGTWR